MLQRLVPCVFLIGIWWSFFIAGVSRVDRVRSECTTTATVGVTLDVSLSDLWDDPQHVATISDSVSEAGAFLFAGSVGGGIGPRAVYLNKICGIHSNGTWVCVDRAFVSELLNRTSTPGVATVDPASGVNSSQVYLEVVVLGNGEEAQGLPGILLAGDQKLQDDWIASVADPVYLSSCGGDRGTPAAEAANTTAIVGVFLAAPSDVTWDSPTSMEAIVDHVASTGNALFAGARDGTAYVNKVCGTPSYGAFRCENRAAINVLLGGLGTAGVDTADPAPDLAFGSVYVEIIVVGSRNEAQDLPDLLRAGDAKIGSWPIENVAYPVFLSPDSGDGSAAAGSGEDGETDMKTAIVVVILRAPPVADVVWANLKGVEVMEDQIASTGDVLFAGAGSGNGSVVFNKMCGVLSNDDFRCDDRDYLNYLLRRSVAGGVDTADPAPDLAVGLMYVEIVVTGSGNEVANLKDLLLAGDGKLGYWFIDSVADPVFLSPDSGDGSAAAGSGEDGETDMKTAIVVVILRAPPVADVVWANLKGVELMEDQIASTGEVLFAGAGSGNGSVVFNKMCGVLSNDDFRCDDRDYLNYLLRRSVAGGVDTADPAPDLAVGLMYVEIVVTGSGNEVANLKDLLLAGDGKLGYWPIDSVADPVFLSPDSGDGSAAAGSGEDGETDMKTAIVVVILRAPPVADVVWANLKGVELMEDQIASTGEVLFAGAGSGNGSVVFNKMCGVLSNDDFRCDDRDYLNYLLRRSVAGGVDTADPAPDLAVGLMYVEIVVTGSGNEVANLKDLLLAGDGKLGYWFIDSVADPVFLSPDSGDGSAAAGSGEDGETDMKTAIVVVILRAPPVADVVWANLKGVELMEDQIASTGEVLFAGAGSGNGSVVFNKMCGVLSNDDFRCDDRDYLNYLLRRTVAGGVDTADPAPDLAVGLMYVEIVVTGSGNEVANLKDLLLAGDGKLGYWPIDSVADPVFLSPDSGDGSAAAGSGEDGETDMKTAIVVVILRAPPVADVVWANLKGVELMEDQIASTGEVLFAGAGSGNGSVVFNKMCGVLSNDDFRCDDRDYLNYLLRRSVAGGVDTADPAPDLAVGLMYVEIVVTGSGNEVANLKDLLLAGDGKLGYWFIDSVADPVFLSPDSGDGSAAAGSGEDGETDMKTAIVVVILRAPPVADVVWANLKGVELMEDQIASTGEVLFAGAGSGNGSVVFNKMCGVLSNDDFRCDDRDYLNYLLRRTVAGGVDTADPAPDLAVGLMYVEIVVTGSGNEVANLKDLLLAGDGKLGYWPIDSVADPVFLSPDSGDGSAAAGSGEDGETDMKTAIVVVILRAPPVADVVWANLKGVELMEDQIASTGEVLFAGAGSGNGSVVFNKMCGVLSNDDFRCDDRDYLNYLLRRSVAGGVDTADPAPDLAVGLMYVEIVVTGSGNEVANLKDLLLAGDGKLGYWFIDSVADPVFLSPDSGDGSAAAGSGEDGETDMKTAIVVVILRAPPVADVVWANLKGVELMEDQIASTGEVLFAGAGSGNGSVVFNKMCGVLSNDDFRCDDRDYLNYLLRRTVAGGVDTADPAPDLAVGLMYVEIVVTGSGNEVANLKDLLLAGDGKLGYWPIDSVADPVFLSPDSGDGSAAAGSGEDGETDMKTAIVVVILRAPPVADVVWANLKGVEVMEDQIASTGDMLFAGAGSGNGSVVFNKMCGVLSNDDFRCDDRDYLNYLLRRSVAGGVDTADPAPDLALGLVYVEIVVTGSGNEVANLKDLLLAGDGKLGYWFIDSVADPVFLSPDSGDGSAAAGSGEDGETDMKTAIVVVILRAPPVADVVWANLKGVEVMEDQIASTGDVLFAGAGSGNGSVVFNKMCGVLSNDDFRCDDRDYLNYLLRRSVAGGVVTADPAPDLAVGLVYVEIVVTGSGNEVANLKDLLLAGDGKLGYWFIDSVADPVFLSPGRSSTSNSPSKTLARQLVFLQARSDAASAGDASGVWRPSRGVLNGQGCHGEKNCDGPQPYFLWTKFVGSDAQNRGGQLYFEWRGDHGVLINGLILGWVLLLVVMAVASVFLRKVPQSSLLPPLPAWLEAVDGIAPLPLRLPWGATIMSLWIVGWCLLCFLYVWNHATINNFIGKTSRGIGGVVAALLILQLFPVSRKSVLLATFGIPFERALAFHRSMGGWIVALTAAHGIGMWVDHYSFWLQGEPDLAAKVYLNPRSRSAAAQLALEHVGAWDAGSPHGPPAAGLIAFVALSMIGLTSLPVVRRKMWNVFAWVHSLYVVVYVFAWIHYPTLMVYSAVPVFLYMFDVCMRYHSATFVTTEISAVQRRSGGITKLTIRKEGFTFAPLQYVLINIDAPGGFPSQEWHPFSIASGPGNATDSGLSSFDLFVKQTGPFTKRLADATTEWNVKVQGPFGNPSIPLLVKNRYSRIILCTGGIGITPALSFVTAAVGRHGSCPDDVEKRTDIDFVWSYRGDPAASPYGPELVDLYDKTAVRARAGESACNVAWCLYNTAEFSDLPKKSVLPVTNGRPSWAAVFASCPADTGVFACGPETFVRDVEAAAFSRRLPVHKEVFHF
ncbi:Ferric reduction oxidase 6 [Diplonema papillatum]|nr:Ferric reduction oxidase 6 [Diplonema papillatum]